METENTSSIEITKGEAYLRELESIAASHRGHLRAADVVEFAKDPETALHSRFTWDDTEAADRWRLQQARQIIRIAVTMYGDDHPMPFRAFVSLQGDRQSGNGYRALATVLSDEDLRERLLEQARQELEGFRRKYSALIELSKVFEAIDEVA